MATAFFRMAYAVIVSRGIRSLPMLKCSSERWVCAPQSLSAGTSTSPRLSVSLRMLVILSFLLSAAGSRCKLSADRLPQTVNAGNFRMNANQTTKPLVQFITYFLRPLSDASQLGQELLSQTGIGTRTNLTSTRIGGCRWELKESTGVSNELISSANQHALPNRTPVNCGDSMGPFQTISPR